MAKRRRFVVKNVYWPDMPVWAVIDRDSSDFHVAHVHSYKRLAQEIADMLESGVLVPYRRNDLEKGGRVVLHEVTEIAGDPQATSHRS